MVLLFCSLASECTSLQKSASCCAHCICSLKTPAHHSQDSSPALRCSTGSLKTQRGLPGAAWCRAIHESALVVPHWNRDTRYSLDEMDNYACIHIGPLIGFSLCLCPGPVCGKNSHPFLLLNHYLGAWDLTTCPSSLPYEESSPPSFPIILWGSHLWPTVLVGSLRSVLREITDSAGLWTGAI